MWLEYTKEYTELRPNSVKLVMFSVGRLLLCYYISSAYRFENVFLMQLQMTPYLNFQVKCECLIL